MNNKLIMDITEFDDGIVSYGPLTEDQKDRYNRLPRETVVPRDIKLSVPTFDKKNDEGNDDYNCDLDVQELEFTKNQSLDNDTCSYEKLSGKNEDNFNKLTNVQKSEVLVKTKIPCKVMKRSMTKHTCIPKFVGIPGLSYISNLTNKKLHSESKNV